MQNVTWDYNGYLDSCWFNLQKDWNQTLFTKINQISAQISQSTLSGGANTITMNSSVYLLVEDFKYTDITNQTVAGRYKIVIDDTLPNIIKVSRENVSGEVKILNYEYPR